MQIRRRWRAPAVAGGIVALVALVGAPASLASTSSGATNVVFTAASGCATCRTLVLKNSDGSTPISSLDLSSLSKGFIAEVQDSGIDPAALGNFSVQATMSNLYGYNSSSKQYSCSSMIGSGAVSLTSLPGLLDENSLSATVEPVFTISGTISNLSAPALAALASISGLNLSPAITGVQGTAATTLTQAEQAAGSTATDLVGSLLSGLPVQLSTGAGGPFTTPAAPPSGSGCSGNGSGATEVPVLNGALPVTNPLLGDLQKVLNGQTVASLISAGDLDPSTVETDIATATGIPLQDLNSTTAPFAGMLSTIESDLTATVTGLVDPATTLTGHYDASPVVSINPSGVPAGSYQGVLTITLFDPPPAP